MVLWIRGAVFFAAEMVPVILLLPRCSSVTAQITQGIEGIKERKQVGRKFIAYFQSFTNTYAPVAYLEPLYKEALAHPDVVMLSIATRPDCLPPDVLHLLAECNRIKPVIVELGLQTSSETTAQFIRRGYPLSVYDDAATKLKGLGIEVVTHVIAGLPGETKQDFYNTLSHVAACHSDGIKIQLLHILKGTDLAAFYESGQCTVLTQEEYIDLVLQSIALLSTGDNDSPSYRRRTKRIAARPFMEQPQTRGA